CYRSFLPLRHFSRCSFNDLDRIPTFDDHVELSVVHIFFLLLATASICTPLRYKSRILIVSRSLRCTLSGTCLVSTPRGVAAIASSRFLIISSVYFFCIFSD